MDELEEVIYANTTLAVALFGNEVVQQCIQQGCRDMPREELFSLKREIFQLFPKYHRDVAGFEGVWSHP